VYVGGGGEEKLNIKRQLIKFFLTLFTHLIIYFPNSANKTLKTQVFITSGEKLIFLKSGEGVGF